MRYLLLPMLGVLGCTKEPVDTDPTWMLDERLELWCHHSRFIPGPDSEEPCETPEYDPLTRQLLPRCTLTDGTLVHEQGGLYERHMFDPDGVHIATWLGTDVFSDGIFAGPFFYGMYIESCLRN